MTDDELKTLQTIGIHTGVPELYRTAQSLSYPPPQGCELWPDASDLRLAGPNGTGKTTFASSLFVRWVRRLEWVEGHASWLQKLTSRWVTGSDVIDDVKASFNDKRHRVTDWQKPKLLLIDDALMNGMSEHDIGVIQKLMTNRINRGLPTIVTTNLDLREIDTLSSYLGSRIAAFRDCWVDGADHRLGSA